MSELLALNLVAAEMVMDNLFLITSYPLVGLNTKIHHRPNTVLTTESPCYV